MVRGFTSLLLVVAGIAALADAGVAHRANQAALSAPPALSVPFIPGETLTYDVSWSSFITAGTATLSVAKQPGSEDADGYYLLGEGRTTGLVAKLYKLYYRVDALLDPASLLPRRASIYSEEGRRRRTKIFRFDRAADRAEYEFQTATLTRKTFPVPEASRDILSAIYALRALPLEKGNRLTMPVADSGKIYGVELVVKGRERIRTGLGRIDAWKVEPRIVSGEERARRMTIWIGADERRLPVRMKVQIAVGSFTFTLQEAKGVRAADAL
jgi:hypothetical protein